MNGNRKENIVVQLKVLRIKTLDNPRKTQQKILFGEDINPRMKVNFSFFLIFFQPKADSMV